MALIGFLDTVTHERIAGWAKDTEQPDVPVGFVIAVGERVVARCLADRFRADVRDAGFGDAHCGFEIWLPQPLPPLSQQVVTLRHEGSGEHLYGSPHLLPASTVLDEVTREAIATIADAVVDPDALADALRVFAGHAERLRDRLAARRSGGWDRQRRRGLGWQDPLLSGTGADAGPATRVPRALVIDDHLPEAQRDAGSNAVLSHMRALRRLSYDVTFAPATLQGDPAALDAEGIATCLRPWYASVEDVLQRQAGAFDLVYLHRMTNASRYLGLVRQHQPRARLIYGVADLHFLRTARQGRVQALPEFLGLSERQRAVEMAAAQQSDVVITHSSYEAELLRPNLPLDRVHVIPWAVRPQPTSVPFAERRGAAFVAHFPHQPNADAARTLLERVMPAVWAQDASLPCLLVGSDMPSWVGALAVSPAEALGAVPDLAAVFARVRLTVAPLGFGAGIKGKVLTSLAAGIPCACTTVAAEGLDLPAPLGELVADHPAALAAIILRLDRDEAFNAACADAGLHYVAARLSEDAIDRLLRRALA